ncbi:MAG: T9SS type A sorting domain-containing protein [Calditrichaeota bacterium]|nr:T9SS type A sorting domain-containing protein [Calditrichota bacterium]
MKQFIFLIMIILFVLGSQVCAQIVETHEFGATNTYWYIYSSGKTWEFIAQNNMTVETIEVKSVLASTSGGTFHIEISIQNNLIANWDQYVNDAQFKPYFHTKYVRYSLAAGDKIVYKIYGNSSSTYTGGILGINYVKLIGQDSAGYDLQFTSLADMKYARYGSGYTSDGNFIYSICGGISESPYKSTSVERYNPANDAWTEFVTGLIPRRYCSAEYIPSQNKIYIFNGDTYTGTTYTDTVEIVDVLTAELSYSATNPYPVEYGGSAVWNEKIYLFGGSNANGYSNRLYEFDPQTNNWTRLPDMPEAKQTNGEIINGVLYVFGGYSGTVSRQIDAYSIQNSSWASLGEMPVAISAHATAKSGKKVWLVGSYDNLKFLAVYDTETNDFTQISSNIIGRRHSGAVVAENNLYIFGGNQASSNSSALKSLEYADISDYIVSVDYQNNREINNFILHDNYPNPFNPTTTISYSIPEFTFVSIKIFNALGKEVATLVNANKAIGNHQVIFDATTLASGVYFYRLQVGDFIETKKMVLMR